MGGILSTTDVRPYKELSFTDLQRQIPKYMPSDVLAHYHQLYLNPKLGRIVVPPGVLQNENEYLREYLRQWVGEDVFQALMREINGTFTSWNLDMHTLSSIFDLMARDKLRFVGSVKDSTPSKCTTVLSVNGGKLEKGYEDIGQFCNEPTFAPVAQLLHTHNMAIKEACPHKAKLTAPLLT